MKELGKDSRFFHENLSPSIDKFGVDLVFACGELSRYLFENLREEKRGGWYENSQKLSEDIVSKIAITEFSADKNDTFDTFSIKENSNLNIINDDTNK